MKNFKILKQLYEENKIDEINSIIETNTLEDNNLLLAFTSSNGITDLVRKLLPFSEPHSMDNVSLTLATEQGYLDIVRLLLPRCILKENSPQLIKAAEYGHLEIVQILLDHIDPKLNNYEALLLASKNAHLNVVEQLIPYSNISNVVEQLKNNNDQKIQDNIDKSLNFINQYNSQKNYRKKLH